MTSIERSSELAPASVSSYEVSVDEVMTAQRKQIISKQETANGTRMLLKMGGIPFPQAFLRGNMPEPKSNGTSVSNYRPLS